MLDNDITLAYKLNGIALPPDGGFPFQLVSEGKWEYKWGKIGPVKTTPKFYLTLYNRNTLNKK
ncbi:MAG: molybdopterin-dependent oxidoreductase [Methanosarcinales archaeon]|nr:molybdopterin-dependent oxidoreductase [Methanosarcinales archaeon]